MELGWLLPQVTVIQATFARKVLQADTLCVSQRSVKANTAFARSAMPVYRAHRTQCHALILTI